MVSKMVFVKQISNKVEFARFLFARSHWKFELKSRKLKIGLQRKANRLQLTNVDVDGLRLESERKSTLKDILQLNLSAIMRKNHTFARDLNWWFAVL